MKKTILASAIVLASAGALACGGSSGGPDCGSAVSGSFTAAGAAAVVGNNGGHASVVTGASAQNTTYSGRDGNTMSLGSDGSASSYSFGTQSGDAHGAAGSVGLSGGGASNNLAVGDADLAHNSSNGITSAGIAGGTANSAAGTASGAATGVVDNGASEYWVEAGANNVTSLDVDVDSRACGSCSSTEITLTGSTEGSSYVNGGGYSEGQAAGAAGGVAGEHGEYGAAGGAENYKTETEYLGNRYGWGRLNRSNYGTTTTQLSSSSNMIAGGSASGAAAGGGSIGDGEVRFYNGSVVGSEASSYTKLRNCESNSCSQQTAAESDAGAYAGQYYQEGNEYTSTGNAVVGGITGGKSGSVSVSRSGSDTDSAAQ
jgi:hypothetical protein